MGFTPRGSQLEHWVDRLDVEVQQCTELTGTNKPITYQQRCYASTVWFPRYGREHPPQLDRVTAAIAKGKRPVTFRTRKLSPSAPMVLHWRRCGRVGHRRTTIHKSPARATKPGQGSCHTRSCACVSCCKCPGRGTTSGWVGQLDPV